MAFIPDFTFVIILQMMLFSRWSSKPLRVLTTMPNGKTDVDYWQKWKWYRPLKWALSSTALTQSWSSVFVPKAWWPKWRCRGPLLSDVTTCITSASTTALRKGTRTSLSICHRASGNASFTVSLQHGWLCNYIGFQPCIVSYSIWTVISFNIVAYYKTDVLGISTGKISNKSAMFVEMLV